MSTATPTQILRLAAAQSSTFFRPSPQFLVTATARELSRWARQSSTNQVLLATRLEDGIDGLFDLALRYCGLTMERIRELHLQRFSIINPVTDLIDKCVGEQWCATPHFWDGGVSDAATIYANPSLTLFHLALYGELFGPDFEAYLCPDDHGTEPLGVDTRLQFAKYCIPDWRAFDYDSTPTLRMPDGSINPRRLIKETGPYSKDAAPCSDEHNSALTHLLRSSRWRPHWQAMRAKAGVAEFKSEMKDAWWYNRNDEQAWRQVMLEAVMVSQGLQGLEMVRPDLQHEWTEKVRAWHQKIASLETKPEWIKVGDFYATLEYPFLLGDLSIVNSTFFLAHNGDVARRRTISWSRFKNTKAGMRVARLP